ncbi:hypothetical protein QQP08_025774 [Theobroma cacao]|nr:hypothetical protein QQP08_025774 [Theobroma cacao]
MVRFSLYDESLTVESLNESVSSSGGMVHAPLSISETVPSWQPEQERLLVAGFNVTCLRFFKLEGQSFRLSGQESAVNLLKFSPVSSPFYIMEDYPKNTVFFLAVEWMNLSFPEEVD